VSSQPRVRRISKSTIVVGLFFVCFSLYAIYSHINVSISLDHCWRANGFRDSAISEAELLMNKVAPGIPSERLLKFLEEIVGAEGDAVVFGPACNGDVVLYGHWIIRMKDARVYSVQYDDGESLKELCTP
jgi:hypothetical protein